MNLYNAAQFLSNSVVARRTAHNAHNELYHFLMAVEKYGLETVVEESRKLLQERGFDYLKASRMAIERAEHLIEIASGKKTYQPARERLDERSKSKGTSHTAKLDWDLK
ncbi:hypothetical protein [Photobacterium sp. TLY01]|uniref:hypothetical protein n=1 Tax=Photobacterium sp. TLY01 TaxID=2907534 RepID=UPI001F3B3614|nr:hypothetical protein [Photobacterium sp. TLY01]UIP27683.1 hypothetical protein LN341_13965 [Photobacterium sp. TLY01]